MQRATRQDSIGVAGTQRGQALVESLLVLGVLASLAAGLAWLGRLQDMNLQLAHVSRRAAFAHAHQQAGDTFLESVAHDHFAAPGHAWATRAGAPLAGQATVTLEALADVPSPAPGDPVVAGSQWHAELALGDAHVWRATASAVSFGRAQTSGALHDFDRLALTLGQQTSILRGSGAAPSDADVQQRLGASASAWGDLAAASQQHGQAAQQRLQGLDAAWGRAQPTWDWLSDWAGTIPQPYLRLGGQP